MICALYTVKSLFFLLLLREAKLLKEHPFNNPKKYPKDFSILHLSMYLHDGFITPHRVKDGAFLRTLINMYLPDRLEELI